MIIAVVLCHMIRDVLRNMKRWHLPKTHPLIEKSFRDGDKGKPPCCLEKANLDENKKVLGAGSRILLGFLRQKSSVTGEAFKKKHNVVAL